MRDKLSCQVDEAFNSDVRPSAPPITNVSRVEPKFCKRMAKSLEENMSASSVRITTVSLGLSAAWIAWVSR